jgi:uncharacterized membrane protein
MEGPMISQTFINFAQVVLGFLTIPFILFLPGYSFWKLMFPHWINKLWEGILLSVALSLAITMTTGFLYYVFSIPIDPRLWFITQVVLTIIFMILAKRKTQKTEEPIRGRRNSLSGLIYIYSLILVVFSITISMFSSLSSPGTAFTQLWISPVEQQKPISIGVSNNEAAAKSYRLELWQNNQLINTWSEIHLDPGQKWDGTIEPGLLASASDNTEFELRLYDQENLAKVYRSVHFRNGN